MRNARTLCVWISIFSVCCITVFCFGSWLSNIKINSLNQFNYECSDCVDQAKKLKQNFLLKLYKKLRSCRWPTTLISRKSEVNRNATIEHLTSAGYKGWLQLIMRYLRYFYFIGRLYKKKKKPYFRMLLKSFFLFPF